VLGEAVEVTVIVGVARPTLSFRVFEVDEPAKIDPESGEKVAAKLCEPVGSPV
jgi:hypothetical protein